MKKSCFKLLSVGMLAVMLLTACGKDKLGSESIEKPTEEVEEVSPNNPLTGLPATEAEQGSRPLAIMLNNHPKALPQAGISQADLVYEIPVEGGYTRMTAMFTDSTKVEKFGTVRSVRHDFVELVKPFDPIFIHWGGSKAGYKAIKKEGLTNIDGMHYEKTYFYTDKSLGRSLEHTRFLIQEDMQRAFTELEVETKSNTVPTAYQFADEKHEVPSEVYSSTTASEVTVKVSPVVTTTFYYDSETEDYTKEEYGQQTTDFNTDEPVHIKNVFVLYDDIPLMDEKRVDLSLTSGEGYYLSNGLMLNIRWEKGKSDQQLRFFMGSEDAEKELTVNPGNSWVLIAPNEEKDQFTTKTDGE